MKPVNLLVMIVLGKILMNFRMVCLGPGRALGCWGALVWPAVSHLWVPSFSSSWIRSSSGVRAVSTVLVSLSLLVHFQNIA